MTQKLRYSADKTAVLKALWVETGHGDRYVFFRHLAKLTGLSEKRVRVCVRAMRREGRAVMDKVWDEDGWCVGGTGHAITQKGIDWLKYLQGGDSGPLLDEGIPDGDVGRLRSGNPYLDRVCPGA